MNARVYKYLAMTHLDLYGQTGKAAEMIREYLKHESGSAFGHNFLGYVLAFAGELEPALEEFRKALALDAGDLYATWKTAYCLLALGRDTESGPWVERLRKKLPPRDWRLQVLNRTLPLLNVPAPASE